MREKARQLVSKLNRRQTVGGAALLMSLAYLTSQLLGLYRNRLLVAHFGIGAQFDAYNAAFRLPDLLFNLLVAGAFALAFVPVFTEYWQGKREREAWELTSGVLNLLSIITIVGGLAMVVLADPLVTLVAPGFDSQQHILTVNLTRIMLATPVLFAVANVLMAVEQIFSRFFWFSVAGIIYNLGIIGGIVWLVPHYGVYGVALGVVAGAVLQAAAQMVGVIGLGFKYRLAWGLWGRRQPGVRRVIKLMVPRSIDQGIDQINFTVETVIGSFLSKGSITALTLANSLKNVPLVLIASSISTAAFPNLAAKAVNKEDRAELIEAYVSSARLILFLAIPSAVFAVVMRGYIVRLLYGYGHADTASTLGWYAGTIIFFSLFMLVSRVYYAMQDTRTPLYMSLISVPINIVLSIILARQFGVAGLAMSASAAAAFEAVVLMLILRRRFGHFGERAIARAGLDMALAGTAMGGALYLAVRYAWPLLAVDKGFIVLAPKFAILSLIAVVVYLPLCSILKLKEAREIMGRLRDLSTKALSVVRP